VVLHAVFFKVRAAVSEHETRRVLAALAALQGKIDGLIAVDTGPNIDLESKSPGYSHGFVMRFETRAALEAYATHPAHLAAATALVAICEGGAEGITVFDLAL